MLKKLKKAFTITELVIVIAVIAILAAVLIPTFVNVIENANQSAALQTCTNALHDYQPIALTDDDPNNDDMTGVVFVSDDYVYTYINSSLQYVGKIDDLYKIDTDGDKSGTAPTATGLTWDADNESVVNVGTVSFSYSAVAEGASIPSVDVDTLAADPDNTGKIAENLYFYTVKSNDTIYFGWFTMERGSNPRYQTQGASYSRQYGYASLANATMTITFAE